MNNSIFGNVIFNTGWETEYCIALFGNSYKIVVTASAYFEKDEITLEQETAFEHFKCNNVDTMKTVETLLIDFAANASGRFIPRELVFQRDGSYALLLDDKEDRDDGIAVCIAPTTAIVSQDEYL